MVSRLESPAYETPIVGQTDELRTKAPSQPISGSADENRRALVTVVVPTLNEEVAIGPLLTEIYEAGYKNVVVVDGYSTDGTVSVASKHDVKVLNQHGKGKAGAVQTALEMVWTPYLLVMDGDYTYDPADIDRFIASADSYDMVIGFRPK